MIVGKAIGAMRDNLIGPMVHVTSAIRPNGFAEFTAWIKARGWGAVHFKLMNRQPPSGTASEEHVRTPDYKYFRRIAPLMRAEGITPCVWAYVSPYDAHNQGANFGRLCENCDAEVVIVNAEKEFEAGDTGFAKRAAIEWLAGFRLKAPAGVRLGLSTFAQPSLHRRFPFAEFMSGCDFFSPQCYGSHPSKQVTEAHEYARSMGKECWPCFRAYVGDGMDDNTEIIRTTAAAIATAKELGIQSWMFWQQEVLQSWPGILKAIQGPGTVKDAPEPVKPLGLAYDPSVENPAVFAIQIGLNALGEYVGGRLAYLRETPLETDCRLGPLTAKAIWIASGRWPYRTPENVRRVVEALAVAMGV